MLHGMRDLSGPGIEPVSPALADGFFITEPPGMPQIFFFFERKPLHGNSLGVQWLELGAFTAVAWVQSLVRELRCHKPHGTVKK